MLEQSYAWTLVTFLQVLDAERLAQFQQAHEGFEQARRIMLAHHKPSDLVKAHDRFLVEHGEHTISKETAIQAAVRLVNQQRITRRSGGKRGRSS